MRCTFRPLGFLLSILDLILTFRSFWNASNSYPQRPLHSQASPMIRMDPDNSSQPSRLQCSWTVVHPLNSDHAGEPKLHGVREPPSAVPTLLFCHLCCMHEQQEAIMSRREKMSLTTKSRIRTLFMLASYPSAGGKSLSTYSLPKLPIPGPANEIIKDATQPSLDLLRCRRCGTSLPERF